MAKKKEDIEVKVPETKKTAKKPTSKSTTTIKPKTIKAAKTTKDKTEAKAEVKEEEKNAVITDITPEERTAPACQQMLSSIIDWSMDALMFQNIATLSQKMNISLEKAAVMLDANPMELYALSTIHAVLSVSPDKKTVLGKYADSIQPYEREKKVSKGKKSESRKEK